MKFHLGKKKASAPAGDELMTSRLRFTHMLLSAASGSEEWCRATREDPEIRDAENALSELLERLKNQIPFDLYNEFSDAVIRTSAAYADAAMLYGMRIRRTMEEPVCSPAELTRYRRALRGE